MMDEYTINPNLFQNKRMILFHPGGQEVVINVFYQQFLHIFCALLILSRLTKADLMHKFT